MRWWIIKIACQSVVPRFLNVRSFFCMFFFLNYITSCSWNSNMFIIDPIFSLAKNSNFNPPVVKHGTGKIHHLIYRSMISPMVSSVHLGLPSSPCLIGCLRSLRARRLQIVRLSRGVVEDSQSDFTWLKSLGVKSRGKHG